MKKENLDIKRNIESAKVWTGITYDIDIARKSGGRITQSALSKFLSSPETSNPTVEKIRGVADGLGVEAWMLLVKNFPWEAIGKNKPLQQISSQGYAMLAMFETLSEQDRKSIFDYMEFVLKNDERNTNVVREARKYLSD